MQCNSVSTAVIVHVNFNFNAEPDCDFPHTFLSSLADLSPEHQAHENCFNLTNLS